MARLHRTWPATQSFGSTWLRWQQATNCSLQSFQNGGCQGIHGSGPFVRSFTALCESGSVDSQALANDTVDLPMHTHESRGSVQGNVLPQFHACGVQPFVGGAKDGGQGAKAFQRQTQWRMPCFKAHGKDRIAFSPTRQNVGKSLCGGTCGYLNLNRSFCSESENRQGLNLAAKSWQVSSHGRVCNTRGTVSYGSLRSAGYFKVQISGLHQYVHRLVAFAFLGPPPNPEAWQVNHRDGNPSNNHIHNLEYVTRSQNMRHAFAKAPKTRPGGPKVPVMCRATGSGDWHDFPSITAAASRFGLSAVEVRRCCVESTSLKGFEFQFGDCQGTLLGEEWRPMLDPNSGQHLPGREVSSLGRMRFPSGRISEGYVRRNGYHATTLLIGKIGTKRRTYYVHRLVAAAFLGTPPSQHHTQVNHKDGDPGNNHIDNLEFVTPRENMLHYWANVQKRANRSDSKPVESRVQGSDEAWSYHVSIQSAAAFLKLHPGSISECSRGRRKQTCGYEFRLATCAAAYSFPGELWCEVDLDAHLRDAEARGVQR